MSKAYPNYGKKTDMGARQWWTEVCGSFALLPDSLAAPLVLFWQCLISCFPFLWFLFKNLLTYCPMIFFLSKYCRYQQEANTHLLFLGHHQNLYTPPLRPSTCHPHLYTHKPFLVQRRLHPISRRLIPTTTLPHTTTPKGRQAKISDRRNHKLRRQSARRIVKSRSESPWFTIQQLAGNTNQDKWERREEPSTGCRFLHHVLRRGRWET